MSLFYSSNQKRQQKYIINRRLQEVNDENQQKIVDDAIDKELGLETESTNLGKLASRVINKLGNELLPKELNVKLQEYNLTPMEFLTKSIKDGTLSNLFEKLKKLPNNILNKTQRAIRDDLSNSQTKDFLNNDIQENLSKGPLEVAKSLVENLGGSENIDNTLDMIDKSNRVDKGKKTGPEDIPRKTGPKKGSKNKTK